MPISAKEALAKVKSLEMSDAENKWFELLCRYTDYQIDNHFNGEYVDIDFNRLWVDDPTDRNRKINCGPGCHQLAGWRQTEVINNWIIAYEDLCWIFKILERRDTAYKTYRMTVDKRDIKLSELV